MRTWLVVAGSGVITVGTISLLSSWCASPAFWILVPFGLLLECIAFDGPVRRIWMRLGGPAPQDGLGALGGALFFFGAAIAGVAGIVPAVDGTVAGHTHGKGTSYVLQVTSEEHTYGVTGNGNVQPCPAGQRLSKPAWSLAYRCGDEPVPTPKEGVATSVVAVLCALVCWLFVALVLSDLVERLRL